MPDLGYNKVNIFRAEQDVPCLGHNKVILLGRDDLIRMKIGREPDLGHNKVCCLAGASSLKRATNRVRTRMQDKETPDLGSRALSPPTTGQVILGGLQGEWQPEPLNQFKQEELVFIMRSIIRANCDYLNNSCA